MHPAPAPHPAPSRTPHPGRRRNPTLSLKGRRSDLDQPSVSETIRASPDLEARMPLNLATVVEHLDRLDPRVGWPLPQVRGDALHRVRRPLQHDLDRPVRTVARPPRDSLGPRPLAGGVAEENSLDMAMNKEPEVGRRRAHCTDSCKPAVPSAPRGMLGGMNAIWLLIGVLAGAAVALLALRARLRSLSAEAGRAGALERDLVKARADLEHERELAGERLRTVTEAQNRMSESFKALSAEALQSSMAQLTEMARAQLQSAQTQVKGDLDKRQSAVEQLVAPLKDQLGRVDTQLLRLDQERRESRGRLEAQLRTLTETGEKLRTETGALVTALRKPNARGQWGQMQLRNVVELAGMVRHCDFQEQGSIPGEETTLRPDLLVRMPGGKHVIVDAKAPLQGVLDAYQARDEEERLRHLRDHARLLRKHVKQLADKAYWRGLDSAPDLVVMFLPGEHLYSSALEVDPTLIEDAMARHVLIATPTILLTMLRSVAYGWQQERVAESAREISILGRELHGRLIKLSGLMQTLGKRLNSAVAAYNETVGSYEARVIPGARRFAEHGAVAEGSEIPQIEQVSLSARTVHVADETPPKDTQQHEQGQLAPMRLRAAE